MTIVDSLRRARRRERLSLRTVADRSGIGLTNLSAIENARRDPTTATAQRIADALGLTFVPVFVRGRTSAAATSDAVARAEAAGDDRLSYREFIQLADDLASVDGVTRVLLAVEEPVRTETRWDDAIAALVEFRLSEAGAPVPQWVIDRQGSADEPWEPRRAALPLPFPVDISAVAEPFLRRGVLIEKNELQSA